MPSKNSTKIYVKGGFYHIYNRGVAKCLIFCDHEDYEYFIFLLQRYLLKPVTIRAELKNYNNKVSLLAYCLMPTHIHLLIKQNSTKAIAKFVKSLTQSYAMFYNKKYDRVGHLFQDKYKARLLENKNDLLNVSRYVHRNPQEISKKYRQYPYSSMKNYVRKAAKTPELFIETKIILDEFKSSSLFYEKYVSSNI